MLSTLHTNFLYGSYIQERSIVIKVSENNDLFQDRSQTNIGPAIDSVGHAFIGYGFDLLENLPDRLAAELAAANVILGTNVTLSAADRTLLEEYRQGRRSAIDVRDNLQLRLPTEAFASEFLRVQIDRFEADVTELLVSRLGINMAQSRERATLVSMAFNGGLGLISGRLMDQIALGNRAEAWYEIRYNSNGGTSRSGGIAKRRYMESHLFGLYEVGTASDTITGVEAKNVYRMYTSHRAKILGEENVFSSRINDNPTGNANADYQLVGTGNEVQTLQESFAIAYGEVKKLFLDPLNASITVDVLDVQIGGDNADVLSGTKRQEFQLGIGQERNDLILGEGGNDILQGGLGDDVLHGGTGVDIYRYRPGDGNDIIVDSDDKGLILYDPDGATQALTVGIRKATDPAGHYQSPDGAITYQVAGADLTITTPTGAITVKDFNQTNNDLGIRLVDLPAVPVTTHAILGDFRPLDVDARADAPIFLGTGSAPRPDAFNVALGDGTFNYFQILTPGATGSTNPIALTYTDHNGASRFVSTLQAWQGGFLIPDQLLYADASAGIRYDFDPYTLGPVPVDPYVGRPPTEIGYRGFPGSLLIDPTKPAPGQDDNLVGGDGDIDMPLQRAA